jgi:hypothetical protein
LAEAGHTTFERKIPPVYRVGRGSWANGRWRNCIAILTVVPQKREVKNGQVGLGHPISYTEEKRYGPLLGGGEYA